MIKEIIRKNRFIYKPARIIHLGLIYLCIFLSSFFRSRKFYLRNHSIGLICGHRDTGLGRATQHLSDAIKKNFKSLPLFMANINLLELKEYISFNPNINIYVGNPDIFIPSFSKFLSFRIFKKYNVGFWFWELENIPSSWRLSKKVVDEVWVQSEFVFNAFKSISDNVIKIPFYVDVELNSSLTREKLNLPNGVFIFIFTFDFLSYYERKNPEAVVRAFVSAFGDREDVLLLIKTVNGKAKPEYKVKLSRITEGLSNVEFRDEFLSYEEHVGLIALSDCYVSLHRSEGLGLGMAEAMYLGKPVIATNYSGNLEFMNERNACLVKFDMVPVSNESYIYGSGQKWADPDTYDAANYMIRIIDDVTYRESLSRQASIDMRNNFSKSRFEKIINQRLNEILISHTVD